MTSIVNARHSSASWLCLTRVQQHIKKAAHVMCRLLYVLLLIHKLLIILRDFHQSRLSGSVDVTLWCGLVFKRSG